jgi:hypothetical protein
MISQQSSKIITRYIKRIIIPLMLYHIHSDSNVVTTCIWLHCCAINCLLTPYWHIPWGLDTWIIANLRMCGCITGNTYWPFSDHFVMVALPNETYLRQHLAVMRCISRLSPINKHYFSEDSSSVDNLEVPMLTNNTLTKGWHSIGKSVTSLMFYTPANMGIMLTECAGDSWITIFTFHSHKLNIVPESRTRIIYYLQELNTINA